MSRKFRLATDITVHPGLALWRKLFEDVSTPWDAFVSLADEYSDTPELQWLGEMFCRRLSTCLTLLNTYALEQVLPHITQIRESNQTAPERALQFFYQILSSRSANIIKNINESHSIITNTNYFQIPLDLFRKFLQERLISLRNLPRQVDPSLSNILDLTKRILERFQVSASGVIDMGYIDHYHLSVERDLRVEFDKLGPSKPRGIDVHNNAPNEVEVAVLFTAENRNAILYMNHLQEGIVQIAQKLGMFDLSYSLRPGIFENRLHLVIKKNGDYPKQGLWGRFYESVRALASSYGVNLN
jgi:hypothetical protein